MKRPYLIALGGKVFYFYCYGIVLLSRMSMHKQLWYTFGWFMYEKLEPTDTWITKQLRLRMYK